MDCGALDTLVICLEDFDPGVKEAASWALGYIARHNSGKRLLNILGWMKYLHYGTEHRKEIMGLAVYMSK